MNVITPTYFMDEESTVAFLEHGGAGSFFHGSDGIIFKPTKNPLQSDDIMNYLKENKVELDAALLWMADIKNSKV